MTIEIAVARYTLRRNLHDSEIAATSEASATRNPHHFSDHVCGPQAFLHGCRCAWKDAYHSLKTYIVHRARLHNSADTKGLSKKLGIIKPMKRRFRMLPKSSVISTVAESNLLMFMKQLSRTHALRFLRSGRVMGTDAQSHLRSQITPDVLPSSQGQRLHGDVWMGLAACDTYHLNLLSIMFFSTETVPCLIADLARRQ